MLLKCKMCGGDIEVNKDMTIGTCMYCGSTMTLPRIDSDKKVRLFNRANQYRLNNEFDKAYDAYKTIIEEDDKEAEAYWGMLLSEYGVEYVEDPVSKKRVPTCHRTIVKSIKLSTDFELACKYADSENRMMYCEEADEIERIQKKILSISSKLEPYDVFICYKETEDGGERTQDSILAQDIYNELEKLGIHTFFSRITLKEKLGQDYEANIFAALQSSKVMLMVTTSNEHCNAVWVKNEWSRYIGFMQEDPNKILIPVCKGINLYELPPEMAKFQAQEMDKVGAMQELIYAVKQLVSMEAREKKDVALESLIQEKLIKEEKQKRTKELVKKIAQKAKWLVAVIFILICLGGAGTKFYDSVIVPYQRYKNAIELYESGQYDKAYGIFNDNVGYKESLSYMSKCLREIQLEEIRKNSAGNMLPIFSGNYNMMQQEDLYVVAKEYYDRKNYTKANLLFKDIIGYQDSEEMYLDSWYCIALDCYEDGQYEKGLGEMKAVADKGYEPAIGKMQEWQEAIYESATREFENTNWGTASTKYQYLMELDYKDSEELYKKCKKYIDVEKNVYNGTWIESGQFWTNLKIDQGRVAYADQTDTKRDKWTNVNTSNFNEDEGVLYFTFWTGERYKVTVDGNTLKLIWVNAEDQYDSHWFAGHNIFYRK